MSDEEELFIKKKEKRLELPFRGFPGSERKL